MCFCFERCFTGSYLGLGMATMNGIQNGIKSNLGYRRTTERVGMKEIRIRYPFTSGGSESGEEVANEKTFAFIMQMI